MQRSGSLRDLVKALKPRRRSVSGADSPAATDPSPSPPPQESRPADGRQLPPSALARSLSEPALAQALRPASPSAALAAVPRPADMPAISPAHFEPLRLLGVGGYSRVYVVRARGLGMAADGGLFVAKVFNKAEVEASDARGNVESEIATLKANDHPFLLSLFASFQTRKRVYAITQYCAGGDLGHLLAGQPRGRLPEAHAAFYAAEVLLALERLHLDGVLYRDLKPDNVLIHASGHVVVADFDLSKRARAAEDSPQSPVTTARRSYKLRRSTSESRMRRRMQKCGPAPDVERSLSGAIACVGVCGTAEYIAPEVLSGQPYSGAADWWSFGVLLYKLVYGTTPFAADSPDEVMRNVETAKLAFPAEPRVSKSLRALLTALLHKDPARRLVSPQEIRVHRFFRSVDNWALLRQREPPFVPRLRSDDDTRHFFIAGVERDEDFEEDVAGPEIDLLASSDGEDEEDDVVEPPPELVVNPPSPSPKQPPRLVKRDSVWDCAPILEAAMAASGDGGAEAEAGAGAVAPPAAPPAISSTHWPNVEFWNPRVEGWRLG